MATTGKCEADKRHHVGAVCRGVCSGIVRAISGAHALHRRGVGASARVAGSNRVDVTLSHCGIVAFSRREKSAQRTTSTPAVGRGELHSLCSGMWGSGRQSGYKSCKKLSDSVLGHDKGGALRQSARVLYPLWVSLSLNGDRAAVLVPEKGRSPRIEDRSW